MSFGGSRVGRRNEVPVALAAVAAGAVVAVALGVYGREHTPTYKAITTFGFDSLIHMKVALATAVGVLALVQLLTALRLYGRLGSGTASRRIGVVHRVSGASAVIISLPVAYHCLWALGYQDYTNRVMLHSLAGCAFYGAFVTKVITLHSRRAPGWLLPLAGALVFTLLVIVVLTSAVWYFQTDTPPY
jgi:subtilisin family serine protease